MKMDGSIAPEASLQLPISSARAVKRLGCFIFYALLVLIALAAIPYGTVQPWWQALFECAVFGLAGLWIIEGYLSGSWQLDAYRLLWPLVALVVFALLQTVPLHGAGDVALGAGGVVWHALSADPQGTRRWASKVMALVLTGAMLLRYTDSERRQRTLAYLVIGVAVASAVFGLLRQMTQHNVGFVLPHLKPGFGYAQFVNKNHFPFLVEMALGLLLGLMLSETGRRERLPAYLGLILLLCGALVLSRSRGGLLSLLCQLIFTALLFSSVRSNGSSKSFALRWAKLMAGSLMVRALLIICLIVVVCVGIVWVGGDPLVGNLEAMQAEVGAPAKGIRWAVRRKEIWPATTALIKEHPVAGVGFGGYWMAIPQYHDGSGEKTPQEAHNDYLEFLASGGLIGLALGAWFIYELIQRLRQRRLRSNDSSGRALRLGALVGLSGVAVHSLVDFGLHITINAVVFMTLLVIATQNVSTKTTNSSVAA
jgi:O-antigen ligase